MVDAIATADASPLFTDEEKAVIAGTTELTKRVGISEETYQRLRRFFDDRQLVELVVNSSVANLNNRVTEALQTDGEPDW